MRPIPFSWQFSWIMYKYKYVFSNHPEFALEGSVIEQLPEMQFLRVHRSFIVNISKITQITQKDVLINGEHIPIGDSYREEVREKIIKGSC